MITVHGLGWHMSGQIKVRQWQLAPLSSCAWSLLPRLWPNCSGTVRAQSFVNLLPERDAARNLHERPLLDNKQIWSTDISMAAQLPSSLLYMVAAGSGPKHVMRVTWLSCDILQCQPCSAFCSGMLGGLLLGFTPSLCGGDRNRADRLDQPQYI